MSLDANIPFPLVGRGQGWGAAPDRSGVSLAHGVPENTPTHYPSPQGGGRYERSTGSPGGGRTAEDGCGMLLGSPAHDA